MTANSVTERNRRLIHDAFAAWHDGTAAVTDVFADDMVWRIEGHSLASREYKSRQEFVDEVLAPFAAVSAHRNRSARRPSDPFTLTATR